MSFLTAANTHDLRAQITVVHSIVVLEKDVCSPKIDFVVIDEERKDHAHIRRLCKLLEQVSKVVQEPISLVIKPGWRREGILLVEHVRVWLVVDDENFAEIAPKCG